MADHCKFAPALVARPGNVKTFLFFLQYPITRVLNKHSKIKWMQNHMVSSDYHLAEKNRSCFCSVLQMVLMDSIMQSHIFIAEENVKTILKIYLWNILLLSDTGIVNQRVPLTSCHFYSILCSTCIIWSCKHLSKWKNYLLTNACWIQPLRLHFLLSLSSQFPEFSFLPARLSLLLLDLFVHQKAWLFCLLNLVSLTSWSFEATVVFSSCTVDTSDSSP